MKLGWILKYISKAEKIVNRPIVYQTIFKPIVNHQARKMVTTSPRVVLIEGTNKCNAECVTCSHKKMKRSQGIMDMDLYKKIVDECSSLNVYSVHPYGFGEPLLDPLLVERIKYAKKKSIPYVPIFSNWSVLTESKMVELINSGLDEIYVSYYGTNKQVYEKVRKNIDFDIVNNNIEKFLKIRNSMNKKKPVLNLFIVKHKINEPDIRGVYKKWLYKVNDIFVWPASNWAGSMNSVQIRRSKIVFPCIALWDTVNIHWNGDVVLCSQDYEGLLRLGNMNNTNITSILKSKLIQEFRHKHITGKRSEIKLCKECSQITFSWPRWIMRFFSDLTNEWFAFLKR